MFVLEVRCCKIEARVDIRSLENEAAEGVMGNKEKAGELNMFFVSNFTTTDTGNMSEIQESQGQK